jgi:hypothetical protein
MRVGRASAAILSVVALGVTLTAEPTSARAPGAFGDGTWSVGVQVPPGIYVSSPLAGPCHWRLRTGATDLADTVAAGQLEVSLRAGDQFSAAGCGAWTQL